METVNIVFRAELFWRDLGRNMTVCPKYEIASGSDKEPNKLFVLAAEAIRKVVNKTVGENVTFFKPEATGALLDRHTISKCSGMLIRGVSRFPETFENKTFSTPRARPEQVHVGPWTRRLFRRPLQRTVRLGSILQRKDKKRN